jgi:hypothetical protein
MADFKFIKAVELCRSKHYAHLSWFGKKKLLEERTFVFYAEF